jgi:hypothetical protein
MYPASTSGVTVTILVCMELGGRRLNVVLVVVALVVGAALIVAATLATLAWADAFAVEQPTQSSPAPTTPTIAGPPTSPSTSAITRAAAGMTLVGVALTAVVTFFGIVLKHSADSRTASIQEAAHVHERENQQRLRMDTAIAAIELLTVSDGKPAPVVRASAAMITLCELGLTNLALALLDEVWTSQDESSPERTQISATAAAHVISSGLASRSTDIQRTAASLLQKNVVKLHVGSTHFVWPDAVSQEVESISPRSWVAICEEARTSVLLATGFSLKELPSSAPNNDVRIRLLEVAAQHDPSERLRRMAQQLRQLPTMNSLPNRP